MESEVKEIVAIDLAGRCLRWGDLVIPLTRSEFALVRLLVENAGRTLSREELIAGIHGDDYPATARSIDVQMTGARAKLGELAEQLETVRGQGYRFRTAPGVEWRILDDG